VGIGSKVEDLNKTQNLDPERSGHELKTRNLNSRPETDQFRVLGLGSEFLVLDPRLPT